MENFLSTSDEITVFGKESGVGMPFDSEVEGRATAVLDSLDGHDMGEDVHEALYTALDQVDDQIHIALEVARRASVRECAA
jgi:hypothetical protein